MRANPQKILHLPRVYVFYDFFMAFAANNNSELSRKMPPRGRMMKIKGEPQKSCRPCRHFTYQPCYVAGEFKMSEHCARWISSFPDATYCQYFEREPGSDDED